MKLFLPTYHLHKMSLSVLHEAQDFAVLLLRMNCCCATNTLTSAGAKTDARGRDTTKLSGTLSCAPSLFACDRSLYSRRWSQALRFVGRQMSPYRCTAWIKPRSGKPALSDNVCQKKNFARGSREQT